MKIISIIGARPQFIKAACISRVLRSLTKIREVLLYTGQHYDANMSDVFFDELEIPKPDYNLGIGSGNHGAQTGRMLEAIEGVLLKEKPRWVLVYGDTNSTLAGCLSAAKLQILVAHVEVGLRCFNRRMPEEINRVLTDHTADLLFAPTEAALKNLQREGIENDRIHMVGDVMCDAALCYGEKTEEKSNILERLGLESCEYILTTVQRAENMDEPKRLRWIFEGLEKLSKDIPVVVPLHPRTRKALEREGLFKEKLYSLDSSTYDPPNPVRELNLLSPVSYLDMVALEKNARVIVTDSGGVRKEAFFYRVPCATLREETEWVELVDLGWNYLAPPTSSRNIIAAIHRVIESSEYGTEKDLYGNGKSGDAIVRKLFNFTRE